MSTAPSTPVSSKEFFATEAPKMIAAAKEKLGSKAPKVTCDIEFEITGEGMYTLSIKNGDAAIRRGGAASPLVALKLSPLSFSEGLQKLVFPRYQQFLGLDLAQAESFAAAEMQKQFQGRKPVAPEKAIAEAQKLPMRVVVEVQPKGAYHLELAVAGAEDDDPTVTITVSQPDAEALITGQLSPVEAFKTGRIKMAGQVSTGMALLSRLFI